MDRYIPSVGHDIVPRLPSQTDVAYTRIVPRLPSQTDVAYTRDVFNTLSLILSVSITLATVAGTVKNKIDARNNINKNSFAIQSNDIETLLFQMMELCGCDRISIALFHGKNTVIIPELKELSAFKYYSIVWESVDIGVKSVRSNYQNTPIIDIVSLLPKSLEKPGEFIPISRDMELPDAIVFNMATSKNRLIFMRIMGDYALGFFGVFWLQFSDENYFSNPNVIDVMSNTNPHIRKIKDLFIIIERKCFLVKDVILNNHIKYYLK